MLLKRAKSPSAVKTCGVVLERTTAGGGIAGAFGVVKKGKRSIGRVEGTGRVQRERSNARGRILIPAVEHKRSSANTGIEAADGDAFERKPTNCCIASAASELEQGFSPFRGVEPWIAAIRRRQNPVRFWQEHKADECKCD